MLEYKWSGRICRVSLNGEFVGHINNLNDCYEFHTTPDVTLKSLRRVRLEDLQELIEINFGEHHATIL